MKWKMQKTDGPSVIALFESIDSGFSDLYVMSYNMQVQSCLKITISLRRLHSLTGSVYQSV